MAVQKSKLITMSVQAKDVETRILDMGGRRLASVDGPNGGALDFYSLNGRVVIVQDHPNDHGIEVYFSHVGNNMKDVYAELEKIAKE